MPGVVLTFPILGGKAEAWRRFCQEMAGSRASLYEASRRRLGITRERMVLVESAFGATCSPCRCPNAAQDSHPPLP